MPRTDHNIIGITLIVVIASIAALMVGMAWLYESNNRQNNINTHSITYASRLDLRAVVSPALESIEQMASISSTSTTQHEQAKRKYVPKPPTAFSAGRYLITSVSKKGKAHSFVFQTENSVGHLANVIPGQTAVDGYIQLQNVPYEPFGVGIRLEENEIRFLIRALYASFRQQKTADEALVINAAKDYAYAILLNGGGGAKQYHEELMRGY